MYAWLIAALAWAVFSVNGCEATRLWPRPARRSRILPMVIGAIGTAPNIAAVAGRMRVTRIAKWDHEIACIFFLMVSIAAVAGSQRPLARQRTLPRLTRAVDAFNTAMLVEPEIIEPAPSVEEMP
jgi:hypothetical protein